jgi:hypothetical protein
MEEKMLGFSREAIKERKRVNYLLMIMLPIMMVGFAYILFKVKFDGDIDIKPFIIIICIVAFLLMIEMFVVFKVMLKKISQMKLIVSDTSIKRVGGRFEETIRYEDVQKLTVKRDQTNRILYIKVKTSKKAINLSGFDDMDFVLSQLKSMLNDESMLVEIKNKINWQSPVATGIGFIGTMLVFSFVALLNLDLYETFILFIPVVLGILFLITKPISKNGGARFRVFEVIISCIMIVCGLIRLMLL